MRKRPSAFGVRSSSSGTSHVALSRPALADYTAWRAGVTTAVAGGGRASIELKTVTQWAKVAAPEKNLKLPPVEIIEMPRERTSDGASIRRARAAVLATVPLDGDADVIRRMCELQDERSALRMRKSSRPARSLQAVLTLPFSSAPAKPRSESLQA